MLDKGKKYFTVCAHGMKYFHIFVKIFKTYIWYSHIEKPDGSF